MASKSETTLSLPRSILLLVVWLSLFFNVERLQITSGEWIGIAPLIYFLTAALLVFSLVYSQWRSRSLLTVYLVAILFFVVTKILSGRPSWGDEYTFLTLFELSAVMFTVTLGHKVGRLIAEFVNSIQALLVSGLDGRVYPSEDAENVLRREMQFARRRNSPLSLLVVQADTREAKLELSTTAQEIRRLVTHRLSLVTLTRLIAQNLRPSDAIVDETEQGRWLLMTSELEPGQAPAILQRLNDHIQAQFGINLRYGVASFPEQGMTLEDLVANAEQDLETRQGDRFNEMILESAPADGAEHKNPREVNAF